MNSSAEQRQWSIDRKWTQMLPPGRPSADHLHYFESKLLELERSLNRPLDACILGSTPEFRDLTHELGCASVTVIDRNKGFYELVSPLCVEPNPREIVVFADWVDELPQHASKFDAILSDLTLGNLPYESRADFFSGVTAALRPGGIYVDKVLTNEELQSLDQLDRRYRKAPINLISINDFANDYFFSSELIVAGTVYIPALAAQLEQRFIGQPRLLRLLHEATDIVGPRGQWYYGKPWSTVSIQYAHAMTYLDCTPEPPAYGSAYQLHLHTLKRTTDRPYPS